MVLEQHSLIETLDICEQAQVTALRERLSGRRFEMLFVNAGVTNNEQDTIGDVTTEEFIRVMVTNSLCPVGVVESLQDLVAADGLMAAPWIRIRTALAKHEGHSNSRSLPRQHCGKLTDTDDCAGGTGLAVLKCHHLASVNFDSTEFLKIIAEGQSS